MINYSIPTKQKFKRKELIKNSNRGMDLEQLINKSNSFYNENNIAMVFKRPTPIRVVKYDKKTKTITKAFFDFQSTIDYNMIYKGKYIDFEAKSTNLKSLPFKNISKHQIEHLNQVLSHGGIAFFIINFRTLKETYFLPFEELQQFLQTTNRKSISVNTIKKKGQLIKGTIFIPVNYVECLDLYLSKNEKIL